MRPDLLIRSGLVYDGVRTPPFSADIGISAGRISFIGKYRGKEPAAIIDAGGMAVAPGFIDTHSHSDFTLLADPRAEGKICQGVTTEINGNCGMSAAPLFGMAREKREGDLMELGIKERWSTLEKYFSLLEKNGIALNIATLAGHGNIRGSVMGYEEGHPSERELSDMCGILREATEQGAIGLSSGLMYPPGVYSETEELVELSKTLREGRLIYTSHMRSEGDRLVESIAEVLEIGRKSGVKAHISHIKTAGKDNWNKADEVCFMLREARRKGVMVTCDRYPYTASATDLDSLLPPWVYAGGNDAEMRRLTDGDTRARIANEMIGTGLSGDYWKGVKISSVVSEANTWMEGETIADIALRLGLDEVSLVLRLLVEENLRVGAIFLSMSEDNLVKYLSLPFCMIGSDSSARCFDGPTKIGKPHPRTFGTFPRFLGRYVRERQLMDLSEAVYRITGLAAETFGLSGRGRLAEGMWADITVFESEKIVDTSTYNDPFQRPEGIRHVLVNGIPALWDGRLTGNLAGKVLTGRGRISVSP